MISGVLSAISFLLSAAKFITKRLPYKELDNFMRKVHKPSSFALFLLSIMHFIGGIKFIGSVSMARTISGTIMIISVMALVFSHVLYNKKMKLWFRIHWGLTSVIFICLIVHIFVI